MSPLFVREGDVLKPDQNSGGPWGAKTQSGRSVIGLLAAEIERLHGEPGFQPARLTVDLYRLPELAPVTVSTSVARDGRRIRVVDAELLCNGSPMVRASCQMLRTSTNPEGEIWSPSDWSASAPEYTPPAPESAYSKSWEQRLVQGAYGKFGQKRFWMREVRDLIGGEPLTPFVRAAMVADFLSPYSHSGSGPLRYINADVTLYLQRLPVGEWVGMETNDHQASDGIAFGAARLYDESGPIGGCSCVALAQGAPPIGRQPKP